MSRTARRPLSHVRLAIFVAGIQILGCSSQEEVPRELGNLKNVVSPGGRYVAIATLGSSGGGAVGSSISWVHLGTKSVGMPAEDVAQVFEGLHSCKLRLEWETDTRLAIHYDGSECNIWMFKNFWYDPESVKRQDPVRVEIVLERQ